MHHFHDSLICETSTTADGSMSFHSGAVETIIHNRKTFLKQCGVQGTWYVPVLCSHGETITSVSSFDAAEVGAMGGISAEAVVTRERNLPLFLLTADCQPMSFYDPVTQTIALAHVSRATLGKQLPSKVVSFLSHTYGVQPTDLHVYIGPHIRAASYTFSTPLPSVDPLLSAHIHEHDGIAHIDLLGASTELLTQSGVKPENILTSAVDTATSDNHFSYYRAKKDGTDTTARIATVLMMR